MLIELHDSGIKVINHTEFWNLLFSKFFFSPTRCTLCIDGTCELADISFGTSWLDGFHSKASICISRTEKGEELLRSAQSTGEIILEEISAKDVIRGEMDIIRFNKLKLKARLAVMRRLGKSVPNYGDMRLENVEFGDYVTALMLYSRMYLSSKRSLWRLLY
jgi:coenzyme F420 hydrogenase subunit beta